MNKKILVGLLIGTLALGGIAYAGGDSKVSSVDYVVSRYSRLGESYNSNRAYGHRNPNRRSHCNLLEGDRFGMNHLEGLSEEEQDRIIEEVARRKGLTYEEARNLLLSGDYCYHYDLTREEIEKLTDEEIDSLMKDRYENHHRNYKHREDRRKHNSRPRGHHNRGYGSGYGTRRGRGYCH